MPRKNSTKQGARRAYEVAARRVAVILEDPTTPPFLRDALEDMIVNLSNETGAGLTDGPIAVPMLTMAFPLAERLGLRQYNGAVERKGGA